MTLANPQFWGLMVRAHCADDCSVPKLTAKDLAEHVDQLETASVEDLDELLTDLLVHIYPTKVTQDS